MTYAYTDLKDAIFDPLKYPNITAQLTVRNLVNRAVRRVANEVDLHSTRRRAATSLALFEGVYDGYNLPTDLKGNAIADVAPQVNRPRTLQWDLVTPEEFDRLKTDGGNLLSIVDQGGVRHLRVASAAIDTENDASRLVVSALDSLTSGGGTWVAFGDGTNLVADTDVSVAGSGSIRFDISAAGGTTAGIQNSALTSFDLTDYVNLNRSVFLWAWITSTTNITNYFVRLGSSSANYYQIAVTAQADGTAFRNGWNLLRFDFVNKTTGGSPTITACTFAALSMTKAVGKVSETGYRFDHLVLQEGRLFDTDYYSKYPWQTAAGVWIENATADTDLLNADTDEFDLFVVSGCLEAARDLKGFLTDKPTSRRPGGLQQDYTKAIADYRLKNPSQALLLTQTYYTFQNGQ